MKIKLSFLSAASLRLDWRRRLPSSVAMNEIAAPPLGPRTDHRARPGLPSIGGYCFARFGLTLVCLFFMLALSDAVEVLNPPSVEVSAAKAVIHWQTDVSTGTRIQISPPAKILPPADKTPGTDHTATVIALQPGVKYTVVVGTARVWLATNEFTTSGTATKTPATETKPATPVKSPASTAPPTRKIWGNMASLQDHFDRHGGDFGAKNPDDYARQAWDFLQRAKTDGLPAKVDEEGVLRVFDPKTGAFASYNRDGTAKTFFKPGSRDYFERQPGRPTNLKSLK